MEEGVKKKKTPRGSRQPVCRKRKRSANKENVKSGRQVRRSILQVYCNII